MVNESDRKVLDPTDLVERAHARGLVVHPYTFRNEPFRLAYDYGVDPVQEYLRFYAAGVDGVFSTSRPPSRRASCSGSRPARGERRTSGQRARRARRVEQLVDLLDHDRALADRGRDPLRGVVAGVSDGEHARQAGLEHQRRPLQRPAALGQVRAGEHVAPVVALDGVGQPRGVRRRADQDEQRRVGTVSLTGGVVAHGDGLETASPEQSVTSQ